MNSSAVAKRPRLSKRQTELYELCLRAQGLAVSSWQLRRPVVGFRNRKIIDKLKEFRLIEFDSPTQAYVPLGRFVDGRRALWHTEPGTGTKGGSRGQH